MTGGRNGFGAKLANIFSTEFIVETGDRAADRHYRQVFKRNMSEKGEPVVGPNRSKQDFTRITFVPDLAKFSMTHLEADTVALMTKRVYDLAGVTDQRVKVLLNGKRLPIRDFGQYADCYLKGEEAKEQPRVAEAPSGRWEVICSLSEGAFTQVSFANSICTSKGGTHVEYIANQIISHVQAVVQRKNKKLVVKPHQIRAHLWLFVNALIVNPAFDSQTKETLNTKAAKFGSTY